MVELNPNFAEALRQAMTDHEKLGEISTPDFQESGPMRAIGVTRADAVTLAKMLYESYGEDLRTGWTCPECGAMRDAEGDCPEGHIFDKQSAEGGRMSVMIVIVEMCLATGVHLERARWQDQQTESVS